MEIPKTIRFDILLLIIGAGLIIAPHYPNLQMTSMGVTISSLIGILLIIYATGYIKSEYDLDIDLKESEYARSKYDNTRYLHDQGLITAKEKEKINEKIKEILTNK